MPLSDYKCRACGKVGHSVDKDGRLQHPGNCPYCGIENPYPTTSLWRIALVGVLLVLGLLAISTLR
jgi:hypothetical protein